MGLQSALSTALTGISAAETTIDVTGNNLANSNTVGFKSSRVAFATQFLQTLALGSMPTDNSGGTNPRQIGLGTMVADITPNHNQGTIEISANPTDLAIQGEGFFMVEGPGGERLYTRNGIFKFNSAYELVTITGNRLLGYGITNEFDIDRTVLVPLTIPLGATAVAQATQNAYLQGNLRPNGDIAVQARRIQTGILGDGRYTAPTTKASTLFATPPNVGGAGTTASSTFDPAGGLTPGHTYQYRLVWYAPLALSNLAESSPSDTLTVTVGAADNAVLLDRLPTSPPLAGPEGPYSMIRIYRRNVTAGEETFRLVGEQDYTIGSFLDTMDDVTAGGQPLLQDGLITGNYTYYITFATAPGGPGVGIESRPSPITDPINISNGRVLLYNLPQADPGNPDDAIWQVRRIYRCLATNSSEFHFVAEIPNTTEPWTITDRLPDADIRNNALIDLDGPKIIPSTPLVDMLKRDGSIYERIFEPGVLLFNGKKGGRELGVKQFEITRYTTVQDLIDFMVQSFGIRAPYEDPINPIPIDQGSGLSAGGIVTGDGRIILTANNGVDNSIDIGLSGLQLRTDTETRTINLPWFVLQQAVGESAVTDFLVYDSLGIPIRVRLTMVLEERTGATTTYRWYADSPDNDPDTGARIAVGTGRITFDGEGNFISATNTRVTIERRHVASRSPLEFELDFSQISGLATARSSVAVTRQDGSPPGVLSSFIIGEDGIIRGVFSNGVTRNLGQIRLARFANPAGLEQRGQNLFAEGVNSGLPIEGDPGQQGIGSIIAGALELSNTDIGGNLIDLIIASTMYRGNTRVISTVQQLLDELLALRR